jgi:hypothetical protein
MSSSCRLRYLLSAAALLAVSLVAALVTDHPRLLVRATELPALRARMTNTNDVWVHFRDQVVVKALADWKRTRNAAGDIVEPDGTIVSANVAAGPGWVAAPEDDIGDLTGGALAAPLCDTRSQPTKANANRRMRPAPRPHASWRNA